MALKANELKVKLKPRKIDLAPRDLSKLSYLAEGIIEEDPLGRHPPNSSFVINHGDIGSKKFPGIMFPAINPVEFYLYSAIKNLDNIQRLEVEVAKDQKKINEFLLEGFQFCIFSVAAIEAFINQTIPGDFVCKDKKGDVLKSEVEQNWSIEDKIKKVIPQVTGVRVADDTKVWTSLLSLFGLRNDLIHLKTVSSDFRSYQDMYRRLFDLDYSTTFKAVQDSIKKIATGSDGFYSNQKAQADKEGGHFSWLEILRRGLRKLTG